MSTHPDWLDVGKEVEVVRRQGQSVSMVLRGVVVRHTRTSVLVSFGAASVDRFARTQHGYHMVPRYLRYVTELRPPEEKR